MAHCIPQEEASALRAAVREFVQQSPWNQGEVAILLGMRPSQLSDLLRAERRITRGKADRLREALADAREAG